MNYLQNYTFMQNRFPIVIQFETKYLATPVEKF